MLKLASASFEAIIKFFTKSFSVWAILIPFPPPPVHKEKERTKPIPKQDAEKASEDTKDYVLSPIVGTFYTSSAPDQPAFVKVGDSVSENTVICIIEAMKVMNEIKAGKKGIIKEILIQTAQAVEFGTKLFVIE